MSNRLAVAAGIAWLAVLLLLIGLPRKNSSAPEPTGPQVRFFKNVDPDRSMTQVLLRGKMRPGYGNTVDVVEVGSDMEPLTGDTLRAWVQHYKPGQEAQKAKLLRKSQSHDLLVHCYPGAVPDGVRTDNVLPKADSLVHVYPMVGSDYTVVSGQARDLLNFMTAHEIQETL